MPKVLFIPRRGQNPYVRIVAGSIGHGYSVVGRNERDAAATADILHLHWPENRFHWSGWRQRLETRIDWLKLQATIRRIRWRGGALVWTFHNLERHEAFPPRIRPYAERQLASVYRQVDLAVAMSGEQLDELRRNYPLVPSDRWRIAPHPHYRSVLSDARPRDEVRSVLGIGAETFLVTIIGKLRGYKRIAEAIEAFRAAALPNEVLLVAGECRDRALRKSIRAAAAGADNVRLHLKRLSAADYAAYQGAADLALFNFVSILNSGSLLAALSLDCPVLAPATPTFEAMRRTNPGWIHLFDGTLHGPTLRAHLDAVLSGQCRGQPDLALHDPEAVGQVHEEIYAEALAIGAARRAARRNLPFFH